MIIALSDFTERPYRIPNQEESTDLLSFMQYHERELAVKYLLGRDLYDELLAAIDASEESGADPLDEKWVNIIEGGYYNYNNTLHRYLGWVDMIRPALFSLWVPRGTYKFTNIGFVENSAPQQSRLLEDPESFIVEAWNTFVIKTGNYYNYGTFYGFMSSANSDTNNQTYPTWTYNPPLLKNRYGL